jgi:hypothetical protein
VTSTIARGQFDGEFSDNARAFSGTGGVRLVW